MVIFPACKINLGLSVLNKRADGFHNLETVLYPVRLSDILEIIPSEDRIRFTVSGIDLPGDPEANLVMKAYRLMNELYDLGPVDIHLHKVIPQGAGLGGGSSDAAHTLLLLNDLFSLGLSTETLEGYARELGSDCAFFIRRRPVLATQKGDVFQPVDADLGSYRIVIVKPSISVSTLQAYSWVSPDSKGSGLQEIFHLPVHEWGSRLKNDFEYPVLSRYPQIAEIKEKILGLGALYASMTGSGSAVFGIFEREKYQPDRADFPGCFSWSD